MPRPGPIRGTDRHLLLTSEVLRGFVWGKGWGLEVRKPALGAACDEVERERKRGMISGCDRPELAGASPTRIAFLASAPCRRLSGSSVSPACALSRWSDAQRNGLWRVRPSSLRHQRSIASPTAPIKSSWTGRASAPRTRRTPAADAATRPVEGDTQVWVNVRSRLLGPLRPSRFRRDAAPTLLPRDSRCRKPGTAPRPRVAE